MYVCVAEMINTLFFHREKKGDTFLLISRSVPYGDSPKREGGREESGGWCRSRRGAERGGEERGLLKGAVALRDALTSQLLWVQCVWVCVGVCVCVCVRKGLHRQTKDQDKALLRECERSVERRVGQVCGSRWSSDHLKRNKTALVTLVSST